MLTAAGDYSFGQGAANFWVDVPQTVAQSVVTRLKLWQGEWFLDRTVGTPIAQDVVGYQTMYDMAIKQVILQTNGVVGIDSYSSSVDPETRALTITCSVLTQYSQTPVAIEPVVL
jgi:hypothetical protein